MQKSKFFVSFVLLIALTTANSLDVNVSGNVGRMMNVDNGATGTQAGDTYVYETTVEINGPVKNLCIVDNRSKCYQGPDGREYRRCERKGSSHLCWD